MVGVPSKKDDDLKEDKNMNSGSTLSEIINLQEEIYKKNADNKDAATMVAVEHADNLLKALKRGGYTPRSGKEEAEYNQAYQKIYAAVQLNKSLEDMLVEQSDAALEYARSTDNTRYELIQQIEEETKTALNEGRSETRTKKYEQIVEAFADAAIQRLSEYGDYTPGYEHIRIIPVTASMKMNGDNMAAAAAAFEDTIRTTHNYVIRLIIGIEEEAQP